MHIGCEQTFLFAKKVLSLKPWHVSEIHCCSNAPSLFTPPFANFKCLAMNCVVSVSCHSPRCLQFLSLTIIKKSLAMCVPKSSLTDNMSKVTPFYKHFCAGVYKSSHESPVPSSSGEKARLRVAIPCGWHHPERRMPVAARICFSKQP